MTRRVGGSHGASVPRPRVAKRNRVVTKSVIPKDDDRKRVAQDRHGQRPACNRFGAENLHAISTIVARSFRVARES